MPFYEYRCGCGKTFESRYPMGEAPASVPCPCGTGEGRRVYVVFPVLFRPTGWDRSPEDPRYWEGLEEAERSIKEKPSCLK